MKDDDFAKEKITTYYLFSKLPFITKCFTRSCMTEFCCWGGYKSLGMESHFYVVLDMESNQTANGL